MPPTQTSGMTLRVLEALAEAGVITTEQVYIIEEQASGETGGPGRDVISRGLATEADVAAVLEDSLGVPRVELQSYAPDDSALELVPAALAREMGVLPLFEIEGVLTVAIGQAADVFDLDGLAERLDLEVEAVLADPKALQEALDQHYPEAADGAAAADTEDTSEASGRGQAETAADEAASASESGSPEAETVAEAADESPAPGAGEPGSGGSPEAEAHTAGVTPDHAHTLDDLDLASPIDLDVLAVADPSRTMLLVAEILERAVRLGATKVHIAPDAGNFTVAFRANGRLSQVASAPISLQGPLVEAVRAFVGVPKPALGQPSVGRMRCEIAGKLVMLSLSAVRTAAGQRVVVSIDEGDTMPPPLSDIGLPEDEARALESIIERRSGLLLVVSPIGEGASETYYSVLAHAALMGRTSYSVERSITRAIPGVAQVGVLPGSPVAPAAYLSAGFGQDTDVIAIDPLENATDVRLAIEAAAAGKLVVATFAASSATKAISRFLEMGVDSTSLASALLVVVAQRLVSTVCPECAAEDESGIAESLPGNHTGVRGQVGAGCGACHDSGHGGVTRLFEVLPITEPLRTAIEHEHEQPVLAEVALARGMRSFGEDALEKLKSGSVSASELNRVLRFAE